MVLTGAILGSFLKGLYDISYCTAMSGLLSLATRYSDYCWALPCSTATTANANWRGQNKRTSP